MTGVPERSESRPSLILILILIRSHSPIDSPELMKVWFGGMPRQTYAILPMQEGINVKARCGY